MSSINKHLITLSTLLNYYKKIKNTFQISKCDYFSLSSSNKYKIGKSKSKWYAQLPVGKKRTFETININFSYK